MSNLKRKTKSAFPSQADARLPVGMNTKRLIASVAAASLLFATDDPIAPLGTYKLAMSSLGISAPKRRNPSFLYCRARQQLGQTPIDAFILEGLKKAGLKPAP